MTITRLVQAVAACVVLSACSSGKVDDSTGPRPPPPVDTTGTGIIQRATLTVLVSIDPQDAALASTAGISLAGLTVRVQRVASNDPIRTAITNASGSVQFTQLLQGRYTVSVDRALSVAELQRLAPEDREVTIFAAGSEIFIDPPSAGTSVALVATRRGSVILSEFYDRYARVGGSSYPYAHYIEVYNNSDTTVYLDGMLLVRRSHVPLGSQFSSDPCGTVNVDKRLDPDGIWAAGIFAFPGLGTSHPIRPGEAQVIAVDAIDHSNAGLVNLARAQFEIIGTDADIDNPSAANMIRLRGTAIANLGHGESVLKGSLYALALPVVKDTTELQSGTITDRGNVYTVFRVPRAAILDAVGVGITLDFEQSFGGTLTMCNPFAAPNFERSPARLLSAEDPRPMRRRSLGRTADGREILQRTGTAARDFELANPLRRSLDK